MKLLFDQNLSPRLPLDLADIRAAIIQRRVKYEIELVSGRYSPRVARPTQ